MTPFAVSHTATTSRCHRCEALIDPSGRSHHVQGAFILSITGGPKRERVAMTICTECRKTLVNWLLRKGEFRR